MKTIITKIENNRVVKFISVDDELAAAKLAELLPIYPDAFLYDGDYLPTLWVENGLVSIVPISVNLSDAIEAVRAALQNAIDIKAKTFGFSSGNALMLYAGFTNAFQPLAQTFATWEASVWVEAEAYKQEVIAGNQPMLTGDQAVALMPAYPS